MLFIFEFTESLLLADIGVNLTSDRFKKDLDMVVNDALISGVKKMIVTGTDVSESIKAQALTLKYENILYSTAGIHPHNAKEFNDDSVAVLSALLDNKSVVAVGECGLDYNRNFSAPEVQRYCFEEQLKLAAEKQYPVFLHQRDAHDDFINILSKYIKDIPAAVAHCFTGNQSELRTYLESGLYIGITGWICDERRGSELKTLVGDVPLDRLMIETDAPYLLPRDMRPRPKSNRNVPAYLPHICKAVAECYGQSYELIAEKTYQNSLSFFSISS